jgi:hypothetical protein
MFCVYTRMNVCVCVLFARMHVCMHICTFVYTICMRAHMCVHMCVHKCVYVCACLRCASVCVLDCAQCPLRPTDFYAQFDIEVMLDTEVKSIDVSTHVAHTTRGMLEYHRLLVATGGTARSFRAPERFVTPGADLRNIYVLRDASDAVKINETISALVNFLTTSCCVVC